MTNAFVRKCPQCKHVYYRQEASRFDSQMRGFVLTRIFRFQRELATKCSAIIVKHLAALFAVKSYPMYPRTAVGRNATAILTPVHAR